MRDADRQTLTEPQPAPPIPFPSPDGDDARPPRPRVNRLRLALLLAGLLVLALVSTVFGMMMAVASDLPGLENRAEYRNARYSTLTDVQGRPLGVLTGNQSRVLLSPDQVAPVMKNAIIAVEDRRFYDNEGVDVRGIARAFIQDVIQKKAAQGGSTITQQFVKNALQAQSKRTVFQKLREAALAYHLTRKWSKQKILSEYLNAIYFGNGAYGIESAARTYFEGDINHTGCGKQLTRSKTRKITTLARPCAAELKPWEAALLAGMVANPSAYDPVGHPEAARARRDLVLRKMFDQGYLDRGLYETSISQPIPAAEQVQPPRETSPAPYFTTWVRQQVVDHFGQIRAFGGGLQIQTTLDLDFQNAAQQAIRGRLAGVGPSAALVAIDNKSGEVRAMVGGDDTQYNARPFNLATQGQRQPGSAFKPFVLATALEHGISPGSTWPSQKKIFTVPHTGGKEKFVVNNYEGNYSGVSTLARATTFSDNSVFAEVGIKVGTRRISKLAERAGIRTPVSTNYAITLGGLKQGVTPLDLAHAYETFAHNGQRVSGTLGTDDAGPVGIRSVKDHGGHQVAHDKVVTKRVIPAGVAQTTTSILQTVISSGTGKSAQVKGFAAGKTGTTENYGDAWFAGFTDRYTIAVWVGYPDRLKPMRTEYRGKPVAGGTYPAEIWHDFVVAIQRIDETRAAAEAAKRAAKEGKTVTTPAPSVPVAPATTAPGVTTTPAPKTPHRKAPSKAPPTGGAPPASPTPTPAPAPAPTPATPAPPSGGAAPPGQ